MIMNFYCLKICSTNDKTKFILNFSTSENNDNYYNEFFFFKILLSCGRVWFMLVFIFYEYVNKLKL